MISILIFSLLGIYLFVGLFLYNFLSGLWYANYDNKAFPFRLKWFVLLWPRFYAEDFMFKNLDPYEPLQYVATRKIDICLNYRIRNKESIVDGESLICMFDKPIDIEVNNNHLNYPVQIISNKYTNNESLNGYQFSDLLLPKQKSILKLNHISFMIIKPIINWDNQINK